MTCCAEKREIFFGGAGCLRLGRVEIWKKKEKQRRRGLLERGYINFCRRLHRWNYSVCDFVGQSNGKQGTSPYGAAVLNPSVISSIKIIRNNLHVSEPPFFYILNIPSVISLVDTDGIQSSVSTDEITNGVNSIGNGNLKLPTELFHQQFCWY